MKNSVHSVGSDAIKSETQSPLVNLLDQADSKIAGLNFFNSVVHEKDGQQITAGTTGAQSVKFFTDRSLSDEKGYLEFLPGSKNGNQLSPVTMGEMSISDARVLPTAFASPAEEAAHRDLSTKASVQELYQNTNDFLDSIQRSSKENPMHKVMVVIPGFGMTHDQGIATAANLQAESGMPVVYYSWPSQDKPLVSAYKVDERKDDLSLARHGNQMIDAIADRIGAENMVLVGFSQGGKMAIEAAIARQEKRGAGAKPFYAQVFSRADEPKSVFQANINSILNNAEYTAVFASPHDRLLFGSAFMPHHLEPGLKPGWRTGASTDYQVPANLATRFQVIDDSNVNNGKTNHIFNTSGIADWLKSLNKPKIHPVPY